jgi:ATP adenylyltransferase
MDPRQTPCCFCKSLKTAGAEAPWDTVLHDSGNFAIVPTKGALVPGWLLVVAKRHALCVGALSNPELDELKSCLALAQNMVRQNFGAPTVFEHGPSRAGTTLGCGIDHVHVHVAPLHFSLRKAVNDRFPSVKWKALADIAVTKSLFELREGYGLVIEPNEEIAYWCSPPVGVTQMFRRVIAAETGIPEEFDYRTHPHLSIVTQTLARLSQTTR